MTVQVTRHMTIILLSAGLLVFSGCSDLFNDTDNGDSNDDGQEQSSTEQEPSDEQPVQEQPTVDDPVAEQPSGDTDDESQIEAPEEEQTETPDTTAPREVTELTAEGADSEAVISWTDPDDPDFAGVELSWSPDGGRPVEVDPGVESYTVRGLENGSEYTFTLVALDQSGNSSTGVDTTVFVSGEYNITVNSEGEGQVTVTPEQDRYLYGDTVTLIAEAAEGWGFVGWSGGAGGTALRLEYEVVGDSEITATFLLPEQALQSVVGYSTVIGEYVYGGVSIRLLSRFPEPITVTKMELYDQDGDFLIETQDQDLLSSYDIEQGETIGLSYTSALEQKASDIDGYTAIWYCQYEGRSFEISN